MNAKPFVTAQHAARELGVDVSVVVNEITNPMQACALTGGMFGGVPIVYRWEVEEPRLTMHRRRLGGAAGNGNEPP